MLTFDGYFVATESAFVQEKEAMLDRIHQVSGSWGEGAELDITASKLCNELQTLKTVLSKGHLQILRTREETLRLELANCQCAFRVRQLQAEIWRFLPHITSTVETVDYELTIDQIPSHPSQEILIDPDEKLAHESELIRERWESILQSQELVFEEEMQHRISDNTYFETFQTDFKQQNADAHESINEMMKRIISCIVYEKNKTDAIAQTHRERKRNH
jgi:hypothetical protein